MQLRAGPAASAPAQVLETGLLHKPPRRKRQARLFALSDTDSDDDDVREELGGPAGVARGHWVDQFFSDVPAAKKLSLAEKEILTVRWPCKHALVRTCGVLWQHRM